MDRERIFNQKIILTYQHNQIKLKDNWINKLNTLNLFIFIKLESLRLKEATLICIQLVFPSTKVQNLLRIKNFQLQIINYNIAFLIQ
ncbi:unnamed protein product [Paramecium sonneborni]|uniref:Uncharacterized protein n=1 Tax=Paramecium sonneborni TaxID=65129 RepID=A0A8S1MH31_9CILI|nr:unnamed protein product [Paramecium sonneborni]